LSSGNHILTYVTLIPLANDRNKVLLPLHIKRQKRVDLTVDRAILAETRKTVTNVTWAKRANITPIKIHT